MAGQSSEEEENYWPGYVDALTTMTMVLTFVMMVLGVVVFTLAQNVSKTVVQAIAAATNIDTSKMSLHSPQELQQAVVAALNARVADKPAQPQNESPAAPERHSALQAMLESTPPPVAERADAAPAIGADKQSIENAVKEEELPRKTGGALAAAGEGIRILYADVAAVRPGEPEIAAVLGYLANNPKADFTIEGDVVQTIAVNAGGATEGRRRAYYRAMLIREQLIRNGVSADRIVLKIRDAATDVKVDMVTVTARNRAQP